MNASSGWSSRVFERQESSYQSQDDLIMEIQMLRALLKEARTELDQLHEQMAAQYKASLMIGEWRD